jgi:hypothetical protein
MCTVLLPPGVNAIAVNKYIVSYISNMSGLRWTEMWHEWEGRELDAKVL